MTTQEAIEQIESIATELQKSKDYKGLVIAGTLRALLGVMCGHESLIQPWCDHVSWFSRMDIRFHSELDRGE